MKDILTDEQVFALVGDKLNICELTKLNKGWSEDIKYRLYTSEGESFLLRLSSAERRESRRALFNMLKRVEELDIPMCKARDYVECENYVYMLLEWIEGTDLEEVLCDMTDTEQYAYGLEAGRIAAKLHSIPAPDTQEEWETRFNKKIDRKLAMYEKCPIKYDGGEAFIRYIGLNRDLLANRPQCFQHGDYHSCNMMLDKEKRLIIIDFDRADFGDPWEEFNRIVWCAQSSPLFASGMLDGYFKGDVPEKFWRLLALYISSNTLSSIPWAIPFGEDEVQTMLTQAKEVLGWYRGFEGSPIPSWYTRVTKLH